MPRLLLVDDNPSIHRIAESLLAPTDVELVCVDSAAEALDRLARGERFDVALVDTAMPGMDGWTLLTRLRAMEETAKMPIALMAGVLDPVDPVKLAKAPIQGFLKKPIELRELGDRVKALLVTPVVLTPSPFSTVPATPAKDLVKRAEVALPEFRPEPTVELDAEADSILSMDLDFADDEEDLLLLTAEDLWPEEVVAAAPTAEPLLETVAEPVAEHVVEPVVEHTVEPMVEPVAVLPDVHLELEELDLDSLQDLGDEPLLPPASLPSEAMAAAPAVEPVMEPVVEPEPVFSFDSDTMVEDDDDELVTLSGLEDLESFSTELAAQSGHAEPDAVPAPAPAPADEAFSQLPAAASLIGGAAAVVGVGLAVHEAHAHAHVPPPPMPELELEPAPEASLPAAGGQAPAVPSQIAAPAVASSVSSEQAQALVQALLADPVMVDALVQAVVARMGDQVLREIAWEVMPDLAGRLQR